MIRKNHYLLLALVGAFLTVSCSSSGDRIADNIFAKMGDPLPSATQSELDTFARGKVFMQKRFTSSEGLGPNFNVVSCGSCHEKPVLGGSGSRYRDFFIVGKRETNGTFALKGKNGIQDHYTLDVASRVPDDADSNVFAKRNPIPIFGMGLISEIDEQEILKNADPDDKNGDGISGKANRTSSDLLGRFGNKAQNPDIETFVRAPLLNHAGITSIELSSSSKDNLPKFASRTSLLKFNFDYPIWNIFPMAFAQGVITGPTTDNDGVVDPELAPSDLFDLVAMTMLFAAPQPDEPTEETKQGEKLFKKANCTGCHVPTLKAKRGLIPLYSDLLVHDMGTDLADGIKMGKYAESSEFRTQPLWGVAATAPYLHDGRADTIEEAIDLHAGEAKAARDFFYNLSAEDRSKVVAFLESLGGKSQKTDGLLAPDAEVPAAGEYGGPTTSLSGTDADKFKAGRAVFDRDFAKSSGLGPTFNGDACRSCHFDPVIGGAGPLDVNVIRQGIVNGATFTVPTSGTLTHKHSVSNDSRASVDASANTFEHRQTPIVFGLGLIGEIPQATILSRDDPNDTNTVTINISGDAVITPGADGISGRGRLISAKVGRFGWKGNVPTLTDFVRDALSNELGITLPPMTGSSFGSLVDQDSVTDPEISSSDLDNLIFFMKNLAPPPRHRTNPTAEDLGLVVFKSIGCDKCHVPFMKLQDGTHVDLFSDLLIHDVASTTTGIEDGVDVTRATMKEFRTPPLWGLSKTGPYMHDGRSSTVTSAIQAHQGEASSIVTAFGSLSATDKSNLLEFLNSL